ncbi:MAG: cytochrome C [Methylococcales bacterium]|nr:cytochrome C [Methylococcales bacterium]
MPDRKIQTHRHKRRLGLIAFAPVIAVMAIASPMVQAGVDVKAPTCKILTPKTGVVFTANKDVSFSAQASLKDPIANPLKYEWDFSGGVMGELIPDSNPAVYKRPDGLKTTVQFVRDNARYTVHFSAMDAQKRRCESIIEVVVGTPPTGLPDVSAMVKDSQKNAPKTGSELAGTKNDIVVLPFEEWTYQNSSDMRLLSNGWSSASPLVNNLKSYAFKKDRLPVFLDDTAVELRYSAASNPVDPVGKDSINTTSQNYPLTANLIDAKIQKTDMWQMPPARTAAEKSKDYFACSWAMTAYWVAYGCGASQGLPTVDEGYFKAKVDKATGKVSPDDQNNLEHGLFMPGKTKSYATNTAQSFSQFQADEQVFAANFLPVTDIDDKGRVNPFPLWRVEAVDKGSQKVVAKTDAVTSTSKDFKCRECHAKGKIAANPDAPYTKEAFNSSAYGKFAEKQKPTSADKILSKPKFFSVADSNGKENSLFDQEYAAALNYSSIHQFYDKITFLDQMLDKDVDDKGKVNRDTPRACYGCHATAISFTPFKTPWWDEEGFDNKNPAYAPSYSIAMHRFHGELQYNDKKTDIVRDKTGKFVRWDWKTKGTNNSDKSLFPVFDKEGKQLPMEDNCLKCHSGHREQLYRDRMYTAGVSCFDCHGDMLAVGQAFPKNYLDNKAKLGSTERDDYRVPWYDEPDCGSCHVGNANIGNDKKNGFFSAGVMTKAFDTTDLSATPRLADKENPDTQRFTAAPIENYKTKFETDFYSGVDTKTGDFQTKKVDTKVDSALFRQGKDRHGNVACAACHGAAHAVWPNRDPNANDNVTALQLQGHTGTILECNVCHSADSFKNEADLDGGQYSGDATVGILGGPHNTHPVNDPYWWKDSQSPDDVNVSDGKTYGGWHNNYAQKAGAKDEDQCAACHGNDHKGTRLSKTPVDRTFDFSSFDFARLQKAGFKAKVINVPAGTPIGCDTCHSIKTSCVNSPAGSSCGVTSETVTK